MSNNSTHTTITIESHTSLPKHDPHHIFPPPPPQEPPPQISSSIKIAFLGNTHTGKTSCIRRYTLRRFDDTDDDDTTNIAYSYTKRDVCLCCNDNDNDSNSNSKHNTVLCTRVQLWDTCATGRFLELTKSCLRSILSHHNPADKCKYDGYMSSSNSGVVIVCSIRDVMREHPHRVASISSRFRENVEQWKRLAVSCSSCAAEHVPVVLFVNQMDTLSLLHDDTDADAGARARCASPSDLIQIGQGIEQMCLDLGICRWFATSAKNNEVVDDGINYLIRTIIAQRSRRKEKTNHHRRPPKQNEAVQQSKLPLQTIDERPHAEKSMPRTNWSVNIGNCTIS